MADIKNVVAEILKIYPHQDELSNARVTKMVYLSDWRHAIAEGGQITDITWFFDNYGPFVWDIKRVIDETPDWFESAVSTNMYGKRKIEFRLKRKDIECKLKKSEREAIHHVIKQTEPLNWAEFIKLVYSTYPIVVSDRYHDLDLPTLAREYAKKK